MKKINAETRRRLIGVSAASVAGMLIPKDWVKPVIESVLLPSHAQTSPGDCVRALSCEDIVVQFLFTTDGDAITSTEQEIITQFRVTNNGCTPYVTVGGSSNTPSGYNVDISNDFELIGTVNPGQTLTSPGVSDTILSCDPDNQADWTMEYVIVFEDAPNLVCIAQGSLPCSIDT